MPRRLGLYFVPLHLDADTAARLDTYRATINATQTAAALAILQRGLNDWNARRQGGISRARALTTAKRTALARRAARARWKGVTKP